MEIDHEIQRTIISKIRFLKKGARYSDLKIDTIENDLFNYHLQQLVKTGFLNKLDGKYSLTNKGKTTVTNIDEEDRKNPPSFKVSVYMVLQKDNKILLYERRKHPQFGYVGFPSGKIKFGERILDTAARELLEETGIQADFQIIGNIRQIRKNKYQDIIEDGVFYICYANKFSGKLNKSSKEGKFYWEDIVKVSNIKKLFRPSVETIIENLMKVKKKNFILEMEPKPERY